MPTDRAEGKVLQYLYEAHASELALVQTLSAHIAMTPSGPYRDILERHLRETEGHAGRVRSRLREIERHRSLVQLAMDAGQLGVGLVQGLVGQVLATAKAPFDLLRGGIRGEEKLLKNAKDECATEALEIATYQSIEQLAESTGDQRTARMAAAIRADEERFLGQLRAQIPSLTEAVVAAEFGRGTYRVSETGAAQSVRGAGRAAARGVQRAGETVGEATREAAAATAAVGREATSAAEATGREARRGAQRTRREAARSTSRAAGRTREAASRSRAKGSRSTSRPSGGGSPERPEARREPWPGYDEQHVAEIADRLERANMEKAEQVREYESQHKDRTGVIQAAEKEARREQSQPEENRPKEAQPEAERNSR